VLIGRQRSTNTFPRGPRASTSAPRFVEAGTASTPALDVMRQGRQGQQPAGGLRRTLRDRGTRKGENGGRTCLREPAWAARLRILDVGKNRPRTTFGEVCCRNAKDTGVGTERSVSSKREAVRSRIARWSQRNPSAAQRHAIVAAARRPRRSRGAGIEAGEPSRTFFFFFSTGGGVRRSAIAARRRLFAGRRGG